MSGRPKLLVVAAALAAAGLASLLGFFFFRDNFSTHYPIKYVSATVLRGGEIPYWNPTDAGGQPLAGNPNTLTFYPDNILYLFLPAHVAFNLHFLLHLVAAWFAMRALVRHLQHRVGAARADVVADAGSDPVAASSAQFAAWLYVLSGVVITACAFYNLIVAAALIPLAFLAVERRSAAVLGVSFGLLALAAEPVTILGTALGCAILAVDRKAWARMLAAIPLAIVIASPQLIAYWEIAGEVERARGYSAATILNASLEPARLLELIAGPIFRSGQPRLFLSLFVGVIAIPALMRKSRYTAVVLALLFFALGRFNPIAAAVLPRLQVARYPEKLVLPMIAAICVLAGLYFSETSRKRLWQFGTFVPLIGWALVTIPVDWYAPYVGGRAGSVRIETPWSVGAPRVNVQGRPGGQTLSRADYRERAARGEPLFGVTGGLQYVLNRSGDGMHSTLGRIAAERFAATHSASYLEIASGPAAFLVPRAVGVRSVQEAVQRIERGERGIAPMQYDGLAAPLEAQISDYRETSGTTIRLAVATPSPALLFVNQSYFGAWVARSGAEELKTMPLDLDRLGVLVPAGRHEIVLRFGRHRRLVMLAWVASWLALIGSLLVYRTVGQASSPATAGRPARP